jgi:glutathione S-transferase
VVEFEGYTAITAVCSDSVPALVNRALSGPYDHAQSPAPAERDVLRVQNFTETLDACPAGRRHLQSAAMSIIDVAAVVAADFASNVEVKSGERHPNLLRWRTAQAKSAGAPVVMGAMTFLLRSPVRPSRR